MIFPVSYKAPKDDRKVSGPEVVEASRKRYFEEKPGNLRFLIQKRYEWMKPYLLNAKNVVEFGSGAGFCEEILGKGRVKLTDVASYPWLDRVVDASQELPYPDQSLDAVICSNMIHHLASPAFFMKEIARILKPGGVALINESCDSVLHKFIIQATKHEGWNYLVDVFDENANLSDPQDAWDGNNAVATLLFSDKEKFEKRFSLLTIKKNAYVEFLIFLISGGVTAKFPTIQLPRFLLRVIEVFDACLIGLMPKFFALSRQIVLERRRDSFPQQTK